MTATAAPIPTFEVAAEVPTAEASATTRLSVLASVVTDRRCAACALTPSGIVAVTVASVTATEMPAATETLPSLLEAERLLAEPSSPEDCFC